MEPRSVSDDSFIVGDRNVAAEVSDFDGLDPYYAYDRVLDVVRRCRTRSPSR
jgi:hypothetical protein